MGRGSRGTGKRWIAAVTAAAVLAGVAAVGARAQSSVRRVIAEGDLVVLHVHSRANAQEPGLAIVDIVRVSGGRIVEHWGAIEPVPERAANDATMV